MWSQEHLGALMSTWPVLQSAPEHNKYAQELLSIWLLIDWWWNPLWSGTRGTATCQLSETLELWLIDQSQVQGQSPLPNIASGQSAINVISTHPGVFYSICLFGQQGMKIQWLVQKLDFISNELSLFGTNFKLHKRCALLWKLCKCSQIWNCQANDRENHVLLSHTRFFLDLGTCLPHFSINLRSIWV